MILGVDTLWLTGVSVLMAILAAALAYAAFKVRKGFSTRELLIAMSVCALALMAFIWFCNNAVTRIPESTLRQMRERQSQQD